MSKIYRSILKGRAGARAPSGRSSLSAVSNWLAAHKALGAFLVAIGSLFAWFLLEYPVAVKNLRELPAHVRPAVNELLGWHYEDKVWKGVWSSFPEGVVNIRDLKLSDTDVHLDVQAEYGRLSGTIVSRKVCAAFPFLQFLMLEGEVHGKTAHVVVFDHIHGKRVDLVRLHFKLDASVLTVSSVEDSRYLFPSEVRLGLHPSEHMTAQHENLAAHCASFRAQRISAREHLEFPLRAKSENPGQTTILSVSLRGESESNATPKLD